MIPIPTRLKALVPGYRAMWRRRYAALLAHCREHGPRLAYGREGEVPWIEVPEGGPRLHGFWSERANAEVYELLAADLPAGLTQPYFRLVKDYLTRYVYPHMRPDLKPEGFPVEQLFGFHAQHKDAVSDLDDPEGRARLMRAFRPRPDDVIIDGGAFLGFGELRLAADLPQGHLYAIEAARECYALLERNIEHNKLNNVIPLHRALWHEETTLELETGFAQANSLVSEVCQGASRQNVPTITVDRVVERFGLDKLDMLSLTLNGAEVEALQGAHRVLSELRPRIRLAGWYTRGGRKIWELTKARLEPYGYRVFVGKRGNLMALPR